MNWFQELIDDKSFESEIVLFLKKYGKSALKEAMQIYMNTQKEYVCRTRSSISKLKINEIYYIEICGHAISVHTLDHTYYKYGTLSKELKILSSYGFVKCNQSCIVSLSKIKNIQGNDIILINGKHLHVSRSYASKVLMAFFTGNTG